MRNYNLLIKSTIPSIAIIVFVVFSVQQFQTFQQNDADALRNELEQITENLADKRIGRINTISNSITGFYLGSQSVEDDEFIAFSEKILEVNSDVINLFVVEDDFIIQSYPHMEFQNKILEDVLPGYPVLIDGQKTMLLEYPIENNQKFVLGIPFDYFIPPEILGHEPLKLVLYNPNTSDVLFQYDSHNSDLTKTLLSESESNVAANITLQTKLQGYKIQQIHSLEYLIWTKALETKTSEIELITVLFGVSFAIVLFVLIFKTLTLQNKLEEKSILLEKSNSELKEAIRMRNEFATMISHELKTPLTPIKGFCKLLKQQKIGVMNEKQLDYIHEISNNASQLEELIENLLTVRKLDMQKLTFNESEINTNDFLNKIHETWSLIMKEKDIKFVLIQGEDLCVKGDENRLRQVFANLIKNAVDFVPVQNGTIEIGASAEDQYVTFFVKDNGIGISEKNQTKLFQKFYQVDASVTREHGGTGLGLSICQGLIEGMKGTIDVESKEGQGTRFVFKLPRCAK